MITGIAYNGERLQFERWAFNLWISGLMTDKALITQFERCNFDSTWASH